MTTPTSEIEESEYFNCDSCNDETKWEDIIYCQDGPWLCPGCADEFKDSITPYSADQCRSLRMYACEYKLTMREAIDYQTHCHCCGKEVKDGFDEISHQYCKKKCFEYCEDYWYPCYREAGCKVCVIWQYRATREEKEEEMLSIYDFEGTGEQLRRLRAYNPILADETHDEYESRIWSLAYKEDEEEEKKRVKVEKDINTLLA
jgi:hypothetical protein